MSQKLGCFGSVLYQDPASRRCGACSQLADCTIKVAENKIKLDAYFVALQGEGAVQTQATKRIIRKVNAEQRQADAEAEQPVVAPVKPVKTVGIEKLPKKAQDLVRQWAKNGVDFTVFDRGENPFNQTNNTFVKVAFQALMDRKVVTQGEMIDLLVAELKWSEDTSRSHVGQLSAIFPFFGLATFTKLPTGNVFRLKE